ncbi:hypothetical protein BH23CHL2_BH23CHL2_23620 [soil metagenome]
MQRESNQTLTIEEATEKIRDILKRTATGSQRTRIGDGGNLVAAIIPASDFEHLEQEERQRRDAFAAMANISEAFMDVPIEEREQEVHTAVRDARKRLHNRRVRERLTDW